MEEITINGRVYIPKDQVKGRLYIPNGMVSSLTIAPRVDGMQYCMVRTYSAGVFAGYVKERNGKEATLVNARRIWYWDGAATLSQLATEGTTKPSGCKFPCEVPLITLTEVIEIIPITEKAKRSIAEVPVWKA